MKLTLEEIQKIIPHRYPFLFIDRVEELEPGVRCKAIKNVSGNEDFFQGHFPGYPVMPGVIQIEALAQAGAVAVLSQESDSLVLFRGIKNAKFMRQVVPGDVLELEVRIQSRRGRMGTGKGTATVQGQVALTCELSFVVVKKE